VRRLLALVLLGLAVAGCAPAQVPAEPSASTVRVAAASDLRFALDEVLATVVTARDPGLDVTVTYGSSGQFLQQIVNGAPFDLYLSADLAYPQELVDMGRATPDDLFPYAVGRLVLWVPEGSELDPSQGLTTLLRADRIAIANPEHAPYGRAAVAAMRGAGVYDRVSSRLVLGENVSQAAEFVTTGNADAGLVALSLVLSDPVREVGTWWEVPADSFPRLDQGGVVLRDSAGARAVRDALLSPEGQAIMQRYGFTLPEG